MLLLPEGTGAAPSVEGSVQVAESEAETHFSAFMRLEGLIRDIDRQADIVSILQDTATGAVLIEQATDQMIEMARALRKQWDGSYQATSPLSGAAFQNNTKRTPQGLS